MTLLEKALYLQGIDLFQDTTTEALSAVAAIADEAVFEQGSVIFKEHDPADALYVVVLGRVQLSRHGQAVAVVGAREVFGAWAAFDGEPRVVTATASEETRVFKIAYEEFHDLLLDRMEIGKGLFKVLARQIRKLMA